MIDGQVVAASNEAQGHWVQHAFVCTRVFLLGLFDENITVQR